jgi:hypothetical protein
MCGEDWLQQVSLHLACALDILALKTETDHGRETMLLVTGAQG